MLYEVDRSAVLLKPTSVFLTWLNQAIEESQVELTLAQIQTNCRVLLVPLSESPESIIAYIGERFEMLFKLEVASWVEEEKYWPNIDLENFWAYFEVEICDEVFDLMDEALENY